MRHRAIVAAALSCATVGIAPATAAQSAARGGAVVTVTRFTVRFENVSKSSTLKLSTGRAVAIPLSAVVWAVHTVGNPIFTPGKLDTGLGLKGLAEAGLARELAANLGSVAGVRAAGAYDKSMIPGITIGGMNPRKPMAAAGTADGSSMLESGRYYEFTVDARPGDRLSLASMIGQSNDGLIATGPEGIALFDANSRPLTGNITAQLSLWDTGTEVNEEPGLGRNQGVRQGAAHAGDPERRPIRAMADAEFGARWPAVGKMVRVTVRVEEK
ncbi:MAG: spondin domain-containing protein [Gemmatimonadaceae bacterium]